jgi:DNA-binding response OmpR family regulator
MLPRCVLLVLDNQLICWALEKELSAHGVEVHRIETGAAALDRIRRTRCGVVFLDLQQPDGDGLALLEPIRDGSPETKTVVFGCDAPPDVKRTAFARGAWQFVDKPFDLRDVVGLVRSQFGSHAEKRRHDRYLCHLPLRVSLLASESATTADRLDNLSCTTVDVGPGGMRLRSGYPLRAGRRIQARVLRPEDPCAICVPREAEAEVVWHDATGSESVAGLRWLPGSTPGRIS